MSERKRKALTPDQLDTLGFALMEMAKELWIVKDRQIVTEALLKERNLLGDLDAYQPSAAIAAKLEAERQRYLNSLAAVLFKTAD